MAYGRVSTRKTREILRLKLDAGLSCRQVARTTGVSFSTVAETVARLKAAGHPLPRRHAVTGARFDEMQSPVRELQREPDWDELFRTDERVRRAHKSFFAHVMEEARLLRELEAQIPDLKMGPSGGGARTDGSRKPAGGDAWQR